MEDPKFVCWACEHELDMEVKVARKDSCPACDADLHVCKNCRFWDPSYHNECRENISHYIRDRQRANFCMSFEFKKTTEVDGAEAVDARSKLEAMFKKLK